MIKQYLILACWLLIFPVYTFSSVLYSDDIGNRIALTFDSDHAQNISQETLDKASALGINIVEISDLSSLEQLSFDRFTLFLRHDLKYPTSQKLTGSKEQILQSTRVLLRNSEQRYPGQAVALSVFSFPNESSSAFIRSASALTDSLSQFTDLPFYYHSSRPRTKTLPENFSFYSGLIRAGAPTEDVTSEVVLFKPAENPRQNIQTFEYLLNTMVQKPESIIIIPAGWFAKSLETNSGFGQLLKSHIQGNNVEFPLPASKSDAPPINWSVVLLAIIWMSFALHYKTQPGYSAILMRYFTAHSFFVNDIKEHRLRSSAPPFVIIFQHALLTGLCFYVIANTFLSPMGLDALSSYFPGVFIEGYQKTSFFVLGTILALLSHLISVFWLYILNKQATHISQVLNLYSWPLHINLVLVTLLVITSQAGGSELWIFIIAAAFILVWFLAFNFAAVDCAKFLEKFGALYLIFTVGLHLVLLFAIVVLFFNLPFILEPFQLAITLS